MIGDVQGIYVVKSKPELPVKIGITQDISQRIALMQSGNWNELHAHWFSFVTPKLDRVPVNFFNSLNRSAMKLEQLVHKKLKELDVWVHGEWFDCDPDAAVMVIQKVAVQSGYDFFDISAMQSLAFHERMPKALMRQAERMIAAEKSARKALGLTVSQKHETKPLSE